MSVDAVGDSSSIPSSDFIEGLTQLDKDNQKKCSDIFQAFEKISREWLVLVNIESQLLHLINKEGVCEHSYTISTAVNGAGQEEGSGRTPLGAHIIKDKIGDGADPYAVFESRVLTEKVAVSNEGTASIVARIMRLSGLEAAYNQGTNSEGKSVDSFDRYIYIHGTNDLDNLGKAVSGGCIRMNPPDAIALFDKVSEGTPVYIYKA